MKSGIAICAVTRIGLDISQNSPRRPSQTAKSSWRRFQESLSSTASCLARVFALGHNQTFYDQEEPPALAVVTFGNNVGMWGMWEWGNVGTGGMWGQGECGDRGNVGT